MIFKEIITYTPKKLLLLFLALACLLAFPGCEEENDNDPIFLFPREKVQSFSVYTYDFDTNTTTSNWVYTQKDMTAFLDYLENLTGTRVDQPDTSAFRSPFYGVELNVDNPYTLLFIGDYAINYNGEYYKIDGQKAAKMCQSIVRDTRVGDGVSYILNHRYLSLLDGVWDTTYMTESSYIEAPLENASLTMDEPSIDSRQEQITLTIENHTGSTLQFGSMYSLEVLVDRHWYTIGDMVNDNVNICWTTILYILKNDEAMGDTYYLEYLQPLPVGSYRLVKKVTAEGGTEGYLSAEFQVE
ncbi:MAG: hypothetical protein K0R34_2449 [Herbinix sp.]|jgi:hypothetical protein|nr:hypothetical protein [Herbinix sp.]